MKFLLAGMMVVGVLSASALTVKSPSGKIVGVFETDANRRLTYSVELDGKTVLPSSPMGIVVNGVDLGWKVKIENGKREAPLLSRDLSVYGKPQGCKEFINENAFAVNGADESSRWQWWCARLMMASLFVIGIRRRSLGLSRKRKPHGHCRIVRRSGIRPIPTVMRGKKVYGRAD